MEWEWRVLEWAAGQAWLNMAFKAFFILAGLFLLGGSVAAFIYGGPWVGVAVLAAMGELLAGVVLALVTRWRDKH